MVGLPSMSEPERLRLRARGVAPSAEREPAVRQMVREQLERPHRPSNAALYGRAVRIDPGIRVLTVREFLDGYVRPETRRKRVRRGRRRGGSSGARRRRGSTNGRRKEASERHAAARRVALETLVQVAREAAEARSTVAVIDLFESIDRHAERLAERLEALG